jgi:hypothetical protein
MALGHVITRFKTAQYQCRRFSTGVYTDGRYTPAVPTLFTIAASVQPLSSKQLEMLPEGQRSNQNRMLWTTTELFTRDVNNAPDEVLIELEIWTVLRVDRWQGLNNQSADPHFEVLISRQAAP